MPSTCFREFSCTDMTKRLQSLIDHLKFTPLSHLLLFSPLTFRSPRLISLPRMSGKSNSESFQVVKERLLPVLKANWILWPAAQVSRVNYDGIVLQTILQCADNNPSESSCAHIYIYTFVALLSSFHCDLGTIVLNFIIVIIIIGLFAPSLGY